MTVLYSASLSLAGSFLIPILLLLLLLLVSQTLSDPIYQNCETTGNYTANSTYESNLSKLLASLSSIGSIQGFSKKSIGSTPDKVYGLVLCRGDINSTECRSCIQVAAQDIIHLCPFSKGAAIWNYHCVLRHSNQYFFSSANDSDVFYLRSNEQVTEPASFNKTVIEMMDTVFRWAAYNSSRRFATGVAYFNRDFHRIYGLGQCTPDLSGDQCLQCLRGTCKMMRSLIAGRQLGSILGVRCNVSSPEKRIFASKLSSLMARKPKASHLLLVRELLLLLFSSKICSQKNDPIFVYCPHDSNYTNPSPFKTNLDLLLSNLTSSVPNSPSLFSNATVGTAYGLAQCRPDNTPSSCADCLTDSASAFSALCPFSRSAAVRFVLCLLRYSDTSFYSELDVTSFNVLNTQTSTSLPTLSNAELQDLIYQTRSHASTTESKFGAAVANLSHSRVASATADCTRDLSNDDCTICLNQAVGILLSDENTTPFARQVVGLSCVVGYVVHTFVAATPSPATTAITGTSGSHGSGNHVVTVVLVVVLPLIALFVLLSAIYIVFQRRRNRKMVFLPEIEDDETVLASAECKLFDLSTLREATDNFADQNMLGEGGFGPVYKGTSKNGQEIAVKRLSRTSGQGLLELRNEVVFVAKLQHRNLVRLLGCCLQEKEKLLVYEYLPNTSLDKILFDPIRSRELDWSKRYKIIEGISRGLLYLHEDSRLRIIHRDLKPSNILLDEDMNPKISDFGLAKHFGAKETHRNTTRIAGTYGYMAPEYAIRGVFSTKSDVFSFGVMALEIVTGRKNSDFQRYCPTENLLIHVWQQWNEGKALELVDQVLGNEFKEQVLRCIHIGLLCVQEDPTKRPSMASVVNMLSSHSIPLPASAAPAFFNGSSSIIKESGHIAAVLNLDIVNKEDANGYLGHSEMISRNEISISEMEPR
ncbi:hypothetical protein J5N97_011554 [Dioscorea zingiberensis]|uniref:Cysteine-rich receptor-like protein kinase 10 n=1 Tax=Dioscorea zingiberensis TaxID=325984 RepID=A0A9D5HNM2_9LILI|nr:hypothetical protein J5N97_011554 [Dioscorea zingiberensis]